MPLLTPEDRLARPIYRETMPVASCYRNDVQTVYADAALHCDARAKPIADAGNQVHGHAVNAASRRYVSPSHPPQFSEQDAGCSV